MEGDFERMQLGEWTYKVNIEFKKEDCWIGIYWRRKINSLNIWICIIPCFPIHIRKYTPIHRRF